MLKQEHLDTVKATAPVLAEHAETLTKHFYQRMFSHNPEVKPYFNPAHQFEGSQQKALAAAIYAYAANIDNLGALGGAVETIAHKHVSLDVQPEHYDIVGANLLASLKEVLGDGATDAVIEAWGAAYGVLAKILIDREEELYAENAKKPGGWRGFRRFVIKDKVDESSEITSFVLAPEDGKAIASFDPGQYLTVRVGTPDDSTTMRNYSISNTPGEDHYRISVKKMTKQHEGDVDGYVSNHLHSQYNQGDVIEIGAPIGNFVCEPSKRTGEPLVLLAGGVGITPLLSMLNAGLSAGREVTFVHACRTREAQAFKNDLDELAAKNSNLKLHYVYSEEKTEPFDAARLGECDEDYLASVCPQKHGEFYFCGPKPFMKGVYSTLKKWDVPADHINFEYFGPQGDIAS